MTLTPPPHPPTPNATRNMGFFDGENVPDFVAKHDDLQHYFPTLAAPPTAADAGANGTAGGTEGEGADEHDPFAAPAEEGEKY